MNYNATINGRRVEAIPLMRTYEDECGISHYNAAIRFVVDKKKTTWVYDSPTTKGRAEQFAKDVLESLGFTPEDAT